MHRKHLGRAAAIGLAALVGAALPAPASATTDHPHGHEPGTTSIAEVLAADGRAFDNDPADFDILEEAVLTVLGADPDSAVSVLADGTVPLTVFAPNDRAFKMLVKDLTGTRPTSEQAAFDAVAGLGVDTVETVLLYHVVPGDPITYRAARHADGATLETAAGLPLGVDARRNRVFLVDLDPDAHDAYVVKGAKNINKGNLQIAHGINKVLRPLDL